MFKQVFSAVLLIGLSCMAFVHAGDIGVSLGFNVGPSYPAAYYQPAYYEAPVYTYYEPAPVYAYGPAYGGVAYYGYPRPYYYGAGYYPQHHYYHHYYHRSSKRHRH